MLYLLLRAGPFCSKVPQCPSYARTHTLAHTTAERHELARTHAHTRTINKSGGWCGVALILYSFATHAHTRTHAHNALLAGTKRRQLLTVRGFSFVCTDECVCCVCMRVILCCLCSGGCLACVIGGSAVCFLCLVTSSFSVCSNTHTHTHFDVPTKRHYFSMRAMKGKKKTHKFYSWLGRRRLKNYF